MTATVAVDRYCLQCGARLDAAAESCRQCGRPTPQRSALLDATEPAPVRRRVIASLIDLGPVLLLLAGLLIAAAVTEMASWLRLALPGLMLAWLLLVCIWEGTTGQGPGKSACGLRVLDERTGDAIGIGRTAIRSAVKLVTVIGTLGAGSLSYRWDPSGRELTWWDHSARSRVIEAGAGSFAVFDPAARARWTPVAPTAATEPAFTPQRVRPASAAPTQPAQHPPARSAPALLASVLPASVLPASVPPAAAQPAPARPALTPSADDDPTTVVPRSQMDAAKLAAAAESEAPTRLVGRHELADTPTSDHPRALIESAEVTLARKLPGERAATVTLEWDTGARVTVGGAVLVGRDPTPDAGELVDRRLAVGNDSIGVSKTHLALTVTTAGIGVTDRNSTNGVRIERADGEITVCSPSVPSPVREGERIRFGGRWILVVPTG